MKKMIKIFLISNILLCGYNILYSQEKEDVQREEIIIEKKSQTIDVQKDVEEEVVGTSRQRVFLQVGAIESKNGNKFILRKKNSKLEFFIDENITSIFLKENADPQKIEKDNFLIIRGPNNKKASLANAVYIYKSKELYDEYIKKIIDEKSVKIQEISGIVLDSGDLFDKLDENLKPMIIGMDNNQKTLFFYDDSTYFVMIRKINYQDINTGDRAILYFDQRVSLRVKNIPFKIVISRIPVGY